MGLGFSWLLGVLLPLASPLALEFQTVPVTAERDLQRLSAAGLADDAAHVTPYCDEASGFGHRRIDIRVWRGQRVDRLEVAEGGWPYPSTVGTVLRRSIRQGTRFTLDGPSEWHGDALLIRRRIGYVTLPLRPQLAGWLINGLLYGAVIFGTMFVIRVVRLDVRAWGRRCLDCGYPVRAGRACSECGGDAVRRGFGLPVAAKGPGAHLVNGGGVANPSPTNDPGERGHPGLPRAGRSTIDPADGATSHWVLPDPVVVHHGSPVESAAVAAGLAASGILHAAEPEWSMLTGRRTVRRLVTRRDEIAARRLIDEARDLAASEAATRHWPCPVCAAAIPGDHEVCWRCAARSDAAPGDPDAADAGEAPAMDHKAVERRAIRSALVFVGAYLVIGGPTLMPAIARAIELVFSEWTEEVVVVVGFGLGIGWLVWRDRTRPRRGDGSS